MFLEGKFIVSEILAMRKVTLSFLYSFLQGTGRKKRLNIL